MVFRNADEMLENKLGIMSKPQAAGVKIVILHVKQAKYLHDYVIWLRFNDGAEGEVDLAGELEGEVFGPLKDINKFKSFKIDPVLETIVWENGADVAPEFLYENMKILA